jgi:hypothetical protein
MISHAGLVFTLRQGEMQHQVTAPVPSVRFFYAIGITKMTYLVYIATPFYRDPKVVGFPAFASHARPPHHNHATVFESYHPDFCRRMEH